MPQALRPGNPSDGGDWLWWTRGQLIAYPPCGYQVALSLVLRERAIERGHPTTGTTSSRVNIREGFKGATAELKEIRRLDELNGLAD